MSIGTIEAGMLAKSKAGHDKGKVYVIYAIDESYVYLVDGSLRRMENPKKKKKKHVQFICEKHDITDTDDVNIKRILKLFDKEMGGNKTCQKLT